MFQTDVVPAPFRQQINMSGVEFESFSTLAIRKHHHLFMKLLEKYKGSRCCGVKSWKLPRTLQFKSILILWVMIHFSVDS